ncbi:MAG: ytxJ, partial [Chitinophagaceae bacterium]|nr:ytxJ [Chitinophagaceae bacterium]
RLERSWKNEEVQGLEPYYLDLIQFRNISGAIEDTFDVEHQSPQALIIKNGSCVYHASHYDIRYPELLKHLS